MEGCDPSAKISKIEEFFRRVCFILLKCIFAYGTKNMLFCMHLSKIALTVCFKSILLKCMQNCMFFVPHAKIHLSKMKQTLLKIDFFEKNFEKILKVQKFLGSRSGRNFCRHGRTLQGQNFFGF